MPRLGMIVAFTVPTAMASATAGAMASSLKE
jgi:hypothetical protein